MSLVCHIRVSCAQGIAAVKCIRSMKRWEHETFGTEHLLSFVVMATPDDMRANAEFIRLGNQVVPVPGGTNNHNYANVKLIIDIAQRTGVDCVWAGWGHASENPLLPETLASLPLAGKQITWIGPNATAMRALGGMSATRAYRRGVRLLRCLCVFDCFACGAVVLADKISSMLIAQTAAVPCLPWSGSGLVVEPRIPGVTTAGGDLSDEEDNDLAPGAIMDPEVYKRACVRTAEEAYESAVKVGLPVMIKASEGGGGKGIRKVSELSAVAGAFRQVQGEVPGSPIFIMQLAPICRHLEVQLIADEGGNACALFGRDCSVQRRHQKIIEEGPPVAARPEVWRHMELSAIALAKKVGYSGAGTVEYLYTEDHQYYFLELNPRLQVEHPVTELLTGVNLPATQLQIAMGIPLHRMPQIRKLYNLPQYESSPIDFEAQQVTPLPGHVIACRITAEKAEANFQPTSGQVTELNFRSSPNVWGYFSIGTHGAIHEYSDSQFGHVFAWGPTREHARGNMTRALKGLTIRGDISTTVEYLQQLIEFDAFKDNHISTSWLENILAQDRIKVERPPAHTVACLGAVYQVWRPLAAWPFPRSI